MRQPAEYDAQEKVHAVQIGCGEVGPNGEQIQSDSIQEAISAIVGDAKPAQPEGSFRHVRACALKLVSNFWFDAFILCLILFNSILLALYQHRDPGCLFNRTSDNVIDPILLGFFTLECGLKIVAWGFIFAVSPNNHAYLCDAWNWLDFIVVVTGWVSLPANGSGFAFLRVFRVLRPLRSLTMLPEMRVLVNTVLKSIPRLFNVTLMGLFIFSVFAIVGITLWGGIFYRQCRSIQYPVLSYQKDCWIWNATDDGSMLCGGRMACESGNWCGGSPDDSNSDYRPLFNGAADGHLGLPWCNNMKMTIKEPKKVFPETDFIHFDHIGGALLVIFQSMTMEGWTDIMYWIQDGSNDVAATAYFFMVIGATSFFVLNVILAVIAEALDQENDEDEEAEALALETEALLETLEEQEAAEDGVGAIPIAPAPDSGWCGCCSNRKRSKVEPEKGRMLDGDTPEKGAGPVKSTATTATVGNAEELWLDCTIVRWAFRIADSEATKYTILFFIAANVVVMMLDKFPPDLVLKEFADTCETIFLTVFGIEMVLMLTAMGLVNYVKNPLTCFDGIIVLTSITQLLMGDGGALSIFRTFRLLRVVFKIANKWKAFRVLLKSIVKTIFSLGYFSLLFLLVMYVLTLMGMQFFATKFHFNDDHSMTLDGGGPDHPFCPGADPYNVDCVPRSNFDTFPWAFTTIFQIMSGENWNTVMYDSMRAGPWLLGVGYFVFMIVFGQIMMLNLFLTILMTKFEQAASDLDHEEMEKMERKKAAKEANLKMNHTGSLKDLHKGYHSKDNLSRPGSGLPVGSSSMQMMAALAMADLTPARETTPTPNESLRSAGCGPQDEEIVVLAGNLPGQVAVISVGDGPDQVALSEGTKSEVKRVSEEVLDLGTGMDEKRDFPSPPALPVEREALSLLEEQTAGGFATTAEIIDTCLDQEAHAPGGWPNNYALMFLHIKNPIRRVCRDIVNRQSFDNGILVCILISSTCMAVSNPLLDPEETGTKILKTLDFTFSIIFIIEMVMKLLAFGFLFGPDTYLHNGWNWIDGVVVVVSIIDMTSSTSTGFLKTLRILRAFRPLRVISRNQNLKVVVSTIFLSLPELAMYLTVFMLFLLIMALLFLAYLNGLFYACSSGPGSLALNENMGGLFITPLCLSAVGNSVCPMGKFDGNAWKTGSCTSCNGAVQNITWMRQSADTPICVGRCSTLQMTVDEPPPLALCPPEMTRAEELPSVCPDGALNLVATPGKYFEAEKVGIQYINSRQKEHVVPCGGPVPGAGCKDLFCPHKIGKPITDMCKGECRKHPSFCNVVCDKKSGGWQDKKTPACVSCLDECHNWCECQDYCEPLIKDAALCVEQGERWGATISQNFNSIANSLTALFEISTTEGWVDVMYAAVDARGGYYEHPKRDTSLFWTFGFMFFIFFSNMFFLNLSVGVIVQQFLDIKNEAKMVNDEGAKVFDDGWFDDGKKKYYCNRPLSKTGPERRSFMNSIAVEKGPLCIPEHQCNSCKVFVKDPTLTPEQAQWLDSRKSFHSRTEPFMLTNLHLKPKLQKQAFLFISTSTFENCIMAAIVSNTIMMACHSFPQPVAWWDDFKLIMGYIFAFIFFCEFLVKIFALRSNYWKDQWNLFDFFCVIATFVGIFLDMAGVGLGAVMSVIRIFRVARLFRLLRFMKGVNKIFMALVYSLPKLANVSFLLALLLILYSILGVQLFAKNKLSDSLDLHGNFQNFERAFITLFRAMTGEAWNEMMHDLAKNEKDFLFGLRITDGKSWCSPPSLWATDDVDVYKVLKDKCMISNPNQCTELPFAAEIYFISFCLVITFMVLNLVIAVILEGYEDGKDHIEGEVIDVCTSIWKKYDEDYTMFMPFHSAFRYADEVMVKLHASAGEHAQPVPRPAIKDTPDCHFDIDLASIPIQYAKAFDLEVTGGKVHYVPVVKLVLQLMITHNDPSVLAEIQETDTKIPKRDRERLNRMEHRQLQKNNAVATDQDRESDHSFGGGAFMDSDGKMVPSQRGVAAQVASCKLQRRFRARKARRQATMDINRRLGRPDYAVTCSQEPPETGDLVAESVSTTPGASPDALPAEVEAEGATAQGLGSDALPADVEATGLTVAASSSAFPSSPGLIPRSPANVDGLDEPGRWQTASPSPCGLVDANGAGFSGQEPTRSGGASGQEASRSDVTHPPPGG